MGIRTQCPYTPVELSDSGHAVRTRRHHAKELSSSASTIQERSLAGKQFNEPTRPERCRQLASTSDSNRDHFVTGTKTANRVHLQVVAARASPRFARVSTGSSGSTLFRAQEGLL